MQYKHKYVLLICVLFVLHGCATTWKQVDNTIISDTSDGNSTVYFIDDSSYWLGFMYKEGKGGVKIFINDMFLDQLEQNGFKQVYIKPGSYTFSIFPPENVKSSSNRAGILNFVAEINRTYYIVGGFDGGKQWAAPFAGSPYKLIQVTSKEAEMLMLKEK